MCQRSVYHATLASLKQGQGGPLGPFWHQRSVPKCRRTTQTDEKVLKKKHCREVMQRGPRFLHGCDQGDEVGSSFRRGLVDHEVFQGRKIGCLEISLPFSLMVVLLVLRVALLVSDPDEQIMIFLSGWRYQLQTWKHSVVQACFL